MKTTAHGSLKGQTAMLGISPTAVIFQERLWSAWGQAFAILPGQSDESGASASAISHATAVAETYAVGADRDGHPAGGFFGRRIFGISDLQFRVARP
jgi:hypothetical protein